MIRVASAAICALVGIYWLVVASAGANVGGPGFRLLLGSFTGVWFVAAVLPQTGRSARTGPFVGALALGVALFAAVGPVLLAIWTRTDYVRYV